MLTDSRISLATYRTLKAADAAAVSAKISRAYSGSSAGMSTRAKLLTWPVPYNCDNFLETVLSGVSRRFNTSGLVLMAVLRGNSIWFSPLPLPGNTP